MKKDMLRVMLGLACLSVLGCRDSAPPPTDVCIGDGVGGADCTLFDGTHAYKPPSQLKNAWIIPDQKQAAAFVGWCYDTTPDQALPYLQQLQAEMRK